MSLLGAGNWYQLLFFVVLGECFAVCLQISFGYLGSFVVICTGVIFPTYRLVCCDLYRCWLAYLQAGLL